ncbi:PTS glucitol/sorbitol transporter subunit IIA [Lacticaseibacillus nasuensis]|uniref:PTS glucitol/sorbitol transporter subunit IIA n=1 Tax=Lacticaseibacillus nasuensis TaxID=944671 RepID=UPI000704A7CF|nr:PTS glucitol/sorbitol transporter subunit IIA [Lacticaseibacillus nasuensis]
MVVKATVAAIGQDAYEPAEPILILFGKDATPVLRDVALIQCFDGTATQQQLVPERGTKVQIDDQVYHVTHVGDLATKNLQTLGHVTLVFQPVPEHDALESALYLAPAVMPKVHVGSHLMYCNPEE